MPLRPTIDSPGMGDCLAALRVLVTLLEASDARELDLQAADLRISLRRPAPRARDRQSIDVPVETLRPIRAPLAGIWYDSPSPAAPPYVRVGSLIDVGTVIGLIETMKIFNEISSDAAGRVTQIHARRGELVTLHSPLVTVDTGEVPTLWLQPE